MQQAIAPFTRVCTGAAEHPMISWWCTGAGGRAASATAMTCRRTAFTISTYATLLMRSTACFIGAGLLVASATARTTLETASSWSLSAATLLTNPTWDGNVAPRAIFVDQLEKRLWSDHFFVHKSFPRVLMTHACNTENWTISKPETWAVRSGCPGCSKQMQTSALKKMKFCSVAPKNRVRTMLFYIIVKSSLGYIFFFAKC